MRERAKISFSPSGSSTVIQTVSSTPFCSSAVSTACSCRVKSMKPST